MSQHSIPVFRVALYLLSMPRQATRRLSAAGRTVRCSYSIPSAQVRQPAQYRAAMPSQATRPGTHESGSSVTAHLMSACPPTAAQERTSWEVRDGSSTERLSASTMSPLNPVNRRGSGHAATSPLGPTADQTDALTDNEARHLSGDSDPRSILICQSRRSRRSSDKGH